MKTLFENAKILIRANGQYFAIEGNLVVNGEYIDYIGSAHPDGDFDVIKDMSGMLLMPGLINAHGHASMTLLRGFGSGLPLDRWLTEAVWPLEAKMTPEDIAVGTRMACLEMIAGGTTMFSEMYDFPWSDVKAIEESGLKANISRVGFVLDPSLDENTAPRFKECLDFADNYKDERGRVKAEFSVHSEYTCAEAVVKALAREAAKRSLTVNVHVSETEKDHIECQARHGMTPAEYFDSCGILDNKAYFAHCVWASGSDLDLMAEKGVSLVHCPSSNMKLGSGLAPISGALRKGVNVALGTDGCVSNDNLNMFEEMHLAALIHNGFAKDPCEITAEQVIDMATVNGAKALDRTDTGELAVGKKADIIAVDLSAPHLQPAENIPALICYSMQASDVYMTMVDGEILYENGEFKTLDPYKVYEDFAQVRSRLTK